MDVKKKFKMAACAHNQFEVDNSLSILPLMLTKTWLTESWLYCVLMRDLVFVE